jgi:hypothetical protein
MSTKTLIPQFEKLTGSQSLERSLFAGITGAQPVKETLAFYGIPMSKLG